MKKKFLLLFMIVLNNNIDSQTLVGMKGLLNIPSPYIGKDSEINIGANFIDRKYTEYAKGQKDLLKIFITINYLPFVELGFVATRQLNYRGKNHTVDRMFNLKVKIIEEKVFLPSISVGFNNPYSSDVDANHFNSSYIVLGKKVDGNLGSVAFILGYGIDLIKAADYQFIGFFGGISYIPINHLEIILEHDADRINAGLRITLLNHIKILAGLMGVKDFSGGLSFSFFLN